MAFEDFVDGFENEALQELARRLRNNEVSPALEQELRSLLDRSTMSQRQDAFDRRPAIVDVLVALDLEFDFPDGEIPTPSDGELREREEEEVENGAEIEEAERPRQPARPPTPSAAGRPSPFGANVDKQIARQFFGGNLAKAQAWVAAEQERLSRFQDRSIEEFWEAFGADVWGPSLDREEFINPGM